MPKESKEHWREYWRGREKRPFSSIGWKEHPDLVEFFHKHLPKGRKRVIEIGAGPGGLAALLKRKNPKIEIFGVDIHVPKKRLEGAQYVESRAEKLPFKDETFDAAYSSLTLIHANIEEATKELWRVLKPGGKAILLLHKLNSPIHQELMRNYLKALKEISFRKRDLKRGDKDEKAIKEKIKYWKRELKETVPLLENISRAFLDERKAAEFFKDYGFEVEHIKSFPLKEGEPPNLAIGLVLRKTNRKGDRKKKARPPKKLKRDEEPAPDWMDESMIDFMSS